jgi:hypothetical protein
MLKDTLSFFEDFTNFDDTSKGYGLTSDTTTQPERASIAASGFMMCHLILKHHYFDFPKNEVKKIALKSIETLLEMVHYKGFLPHFLNRTTGERLSRTEFSTIDTMLCIMGIIAMDSFLKDETFSKHTKTLLDRIDYDSFMTIYKGKKVLSMAYNDHPKGDYVKDSIGYIYHWHMYAEQLMMYLLYKGQDAKLLYDNIEKPVGKYHDISYVYSPGNTLFIYQFPLAFIPLKDYVDANGFSIYDNCVKAILGHRQLSIDLSKTYPSFSEHAFGFNASDTKNGYRVYHAIPNEANKVITDGTVAPFGVAGSLPYLGETILDSLHYLKSIPGLYGPYGFMDAFNIIDSTLWVSDKIISIDKGLEMLSFDMYLDHVIHDLVISNPRIQDGLTRLNFKKRG